MKNYILLLFSLVFILPVSAQIPEDPAKKNVAANYTIFIASRELENDFAMQQKDIIFSNREKLKELNVNAYQMTPTEIRSVFDNSFSKPSNFNRYTDMIGKEATFRVLLVDNKNVIKFSKNEPMTLDEILVLTRKKDSLNTIDKTPNQSMKDSRETTKDRIDQSPNN